MNDRRTIFGWAMYDWANSAYITTVAVAVLPIFFADVIIGPEGLEICGRMFRATTLWAWMIGFAALIIFLSAPVLGAIADFSSSKKRFLMTFCLMGSLSTLLLVFMGPGDAWKTMAIFIVSQVGFVGGNVFYDAFLPQIASEDRLDRVSGKGFAYGYVGGGLQFALSLALIAGHESLGISQSLAARLAMAMAGLWWGGFAIFTFVLLREDRPPHVLPEEFRGKNRLVAYTVIGIRRTIATGLRIRQFRHLLLFLLAFMIYNDGIQTVISLSTIYGRSELGLSATDLMLALLIIQFVAVAGALVFARLGELITARRALMITLVLWSGVVIYAYFMKTAAEYYVLGIIVGMCMGGSQALSRSLYGSIIPVDASAEFYGFYSVFSKFSAIWGPLMFGLIDTMTGSARNSIVTLIVFFIAGLALLSRLDIDKARSARYMDIFQE